MAATAPKTRPATLTVEQFFRMVCEPLGVAALMLDPGDGKIVRANRRAGELYGYAPGELEAMSLGELLSPTEDAIPPLPGISPLVPGTSHTRSHRAADGSLRAVETHPVRLALADADLLFCTLRDLTEPRRLRQENESLQKTRDQLEIMVAERTRQLNETMELLKREMLERRRIETSAGSIREKLENQERARVARDIHDGIGQSLQAVKLQLKMRQADCKAGAACGGHALAEVIREITSVSTELREIILSLRPLFIEETDLDVALRALCERTSKRTSLHVRAECRGIFRGLPSPFKLSVFRICQEALANIVKHARSESASIRIERGARTLLLVIRDDGVGGVPCPTVVSQDGSGLAIMRERVELLNGSFAVISPPGMGTVINVEAPLP